MGGGGGGSDRQSTTKQIQKLNHYFLNPQQNLQAWPTCYCDPVVLAGAWLAYKTAVGWIGSTRLVAHVVNHTDILLK